MIKRFSKKRSAQNRKYLKLRNEFLEKNGECQAGLPGCTGVATEIHHQAGKIGDKLTDVNNFLGVCRNCHDAIHNEPKLALLNGHSKSRLHD